VGFLVQCHAYAKALHYKEMEFEGAQLMTTELVQAMTVETQPQPVTAVEALIHINNQLNQHEVLLYLRSESWELLAPDHPISSAECRVLVRDLFFVVNMVSDQTGFVILLFGVFFQAAMGILTYAQDKLGVEESW
jgi:FKBP12-rapamycin complex-associated protein